MLLWIRMRIFIIKIFDKNYTYRLTLISVPRLVVNCLHPVEFMTEVLFSPQQIETNWLNKPLIIVFTRSYLVKINDWISDEEADHGIIYLSININSVLLLMTIIQWSVIVFHYWPVVYVSVVEVTNNVLIQEINIQIIASMMESYDQLLLVAIKHRLNQEILIIGTLTFTSHFNEMVRVRIQ